MYCIAKQGLTHLSSRGKIYIPNSYSIGQAYLFILERFPYIKISSPLKSGVFFMCGKRNIMVEHKTVTVNLRRKSIREKDVIELAIQTAESYGIQAIVDRTVPAITIPEEYEGRFVTQIDAAVRRRVARQN
jgi:hypothetical protein